MKNETENKNDGKSIFVYSQSFTDRRGHIIVGDFVDRLAYDNAISALRTAKAKLEAKEKEIEGLKEDNERWSTRCMFAEDYISKSPCDTDITLEQLKAYERWQEAINPTTGES